MQKRHKRERLYRIDLEKTIKQNAIKKINANADWLKKHSIILT